MPSNLIPIAILTQSIEKELAWWRIEPKNSASCWTEKSCDTLSPEEEMFNIWP